MGKDNFFMRKAISLAKKAEGMTSPNPIVGAVIVKNGRIIGKGYHKKCGLPHAEVNALKDAGKNARGAAMYVTLEPCAHFGKTPPCVDAIIAAGIKKVVIAAKDPNPVNNGKGIRRLNRAGIKTVCGVLSGEARRMNRVFEKYITTGMPYVTVKMAESLDGKIATRTGDSKWISSEDSRRFVHRLRSRADAVMVGANTVIKDDPTLTSRIAGARQPIRVIVAGRARIPGSAKIFSDPKGSPVYVVSSKGRSPVDLRRLLKKLGAMEVTSLLVEGGGELAAGFIERRLVDEILFFIAPKIIGGRDAISPVEGMGISRVRDALELKNVRVRKFKKDILIRAEVD